MRNAIKELEEWRSGMKGRYVVIDIDTDFAATCWNVTLGNMMMKPKDDWFLAEKNHAIVLCEEVLFLDSDEPCPPNVCTVEEEKSIVFPGLEKTILTALDKAKELGV